MKIYVILATSQDWDSTVLPAAYTSKKKADKEAEFWNREQSDEGWEYEVNEINLMDGKK